MLFVACSKETESTIKTPDDCESALENLNSPFSGLRNPDDPADDQMNECLFIITSGITHLMQTAEYREIILNPDQYNEKQEYHIDNLMQNDAMLAAFNDYISGIAFCSNLDYNSYDQLKSLMTYQGVLYSPIIYYPNLIQSDSQDLSINQVQIAVGESINEDDGIPGFNLSFEDNTSLEEVVIYESALQNSTPVLIISNHTDEYIDTVDDVVIEKNDGNRAYLADVYAISEDYERDGKSDYHESHKIAYQGGAQQNSSVGYNIDRIADNQINSLFTTDVSLPEIGIGFWLVAHERDWYASAKTIFVGMMNGASTWRLVDCRMKYNHEFFQRLYVNFNTRNTITSNEKGRLTISF